MTDHCIKHKYKEVKPDLTLVMKTPSVTTRSQLRLMAQTTEYGTPQMALFDRKFIQYGYATTRLCIFPKKGGAGTYPFGSHGYKRDRRVEEWFKPYLMSVEDFKIAVL
jgi:hypothetical protein